MLFKIILFGQFAGNSVYIVIFYDYLPVHLALLYALQTYLYYLYIIVSSTFLRQVSTLRPMLIGVIFYLLQQLVFAKHRL